ncbi:MAG: hypothetical protein ABFC63_04410 [Thermoguttaceae bacterium]
MLKSVEGIYRDGKVEFFEPPPAGASGRVIVTFVASPVELAERGVSREQAADLRRRLTTFSEDWDLPEMDAYDAL